MKTFLKNYTSDVPVSTTIYRIEQLLIRCGVTAINKEYGDTTGSIIAVTFNLPSAVGDLRIRLPANKEEATNALWKDYIGDDLEPDGRIKWNSKKKRRRIDFVEQGERTAWRIVQDWVEVQMSMISMNQADPREVFLAYIWDGKQTIYQRIETQGFKALLPEKSEAI